MPHPPPLVQQPPPDAIADCVLAAFDALPQKYKPRTLAGRKKEWNILAGIVVSKGMHAQVAVPGSGGRES
jgi:tRNA-specific adenosine deaminase 1